MSKIEINMLRTVKFPAREDFLDLDWHKLELDAKLLRDKGVHPKNRRAGVGFQEPKRYPILNNLH